MKRKLQHSVASKTVFFLTILFVVQIGSVFSQTKVYWTDRTANKVAKVSADGTGFADVITGLSNPRPMATDGTYLYFGNNGGNPIIRTNLDGTGSTTLINSSAADIFIKNSYIYYTTWTGGVFRANKSDGTGSVNLVTGAVLGGSSSGYQAIWVTDTKIYFGNYNDNKIYTCNLDGSSVALLYNVGTGTLPTDICVTDKYVYISSISSTSSIKRIGLDGTNPTSIGAIGSYYSIALDNNVIYYTTSSTNIGKMNVDGTGQTTIYSGALGSHGIAVVAGSSTTSIQNNLSDKIQLNVTNKKLYVSAENENIQLVEIYNMSGSEILKTNMSQIDVSSMPEGVYIIKVKTDKNTLCKKVFFQ